VIYPFISALRGEATLKARLPKEARRNAAISPYDRGVANTPYWTSLNGPLEERGPPCVGELLQHTKKGPCSLCCFWNLLEILIKKYQEM
jgi:hypothetical protein